MEKLLLPTIRLKYIGAALFVLLSTFVLANAFNPVGHTPVFNHSDGAPAGVAASGLQPGIAAIRISVEAWTGETFTVDTFSSDAIEQLKQKIEDNEGIPAAQQQLVFGGIALKDGRTLDDYGIQNGSMLQLLRRMQTGNGNVLYVDINVDTNYPQYTGIGDSWTNAVPQLADALRWAREQHTGGSPGWSSADPLRIYVAIGTYLPAYHAGDESYTTNGDRLNAFVLVPNVQLYGGFDPANGVEDLEDTRILPDADNPGQGTVLSGDLDGDDGEDFSGYLENAHHVVIAAGDLGVAGMDGFTITAGTASGDVGGSFSVNGFSVSSEAGGGMLAFFSSPSLTDCLFSRNQAIQGGGMSNAGAVSTPSLVRCTFRGNIAENGAGMANLQAAPLLTGCMFLENSAQQGGGGMSNMMANPSVTGTTFRGNSADAGGGMANSGSTPSLDQCDFSENTARNGGGIMNTGSTLSLTGCTFSRNSAEADGGGMHNIESGLTLTGCTFLQNSADQRGGGMRNDRTSVTILNSRIANNTAPQGGGIINESCPAISLTNCILSGNSAMMGAGMMSGICESVELTNCTVSGNTASMMGGGLAGMQASASLSNVVIWDNEVDGDRTAPEVSLYHMAGDLPVVSHSLIANWGGSDNWNGSLGVDGGGNIDADPLFTDPANGDYRLQTCSPAINKGDNALLPGGVTLDASGNPRTVHTVVDMGAFEYQDAFPAGNLAIHNDESTKNISGPTDFYGNDEACRLIVRIVPAGADPVSGSVTATVEIDPEVAFHNGSPYVQRHYLVNAPAGGSARVTLYFTQDEFDNFNDEMPGGYLPISPIDNSNKNNLRVYQYHGTTGSTPGDYQGSPLTVIAPNVEDIVWNAVSGRWEVSFGVEGFSGFFIGSVASPLPVRLVSFSGSAEAENTVGLRWEVVDQQNIEAYTVEYSPNGTNFEEAGIVAATQTPETRYTFRHMPLRGKGIAYYRLRISEADGTRSNSNIISVNLPGRSLASVYPVPADYGFWVEGQGVAGTTARLVNIQGIVLKTWAISSDKQYVDISLLPSGIYFVMLQDGTSLKVVRK